MWVGKAGLHTMLKRMQAKLVEIKKALWRMLHMLLATSQHHNGRSPVALGA
jgi:hypothetical protein